MDRRDKRMRKYQYNDACLIWEISRLLKDVEGKAETEIPKVVSILLDPSTRAGSCCKEAVESSVDDRLLKRDIKDILENVRVRCDDKNYSLLDDDVNKIIAAYKDAAPSLQTTS